MASQKAEDKKKSEKKPQNKQKIGFKYITGLLFAAFTETAQGLFTTYREPDNMDFVADAIGILSCTFFIWVFQKPLRKLFDRLQEYFHKVLYK